MDNFDLKKFVSEKTLLNENTPGYNTRKTPNAINEFTLTGSQVLKGMVDGKLTYIIEHDGQELRVSEKDWKAFKDMISVKAAYEADMGEGELNEAPLMATNLDSEVYGRIDGLTNIKLLQELLDKAIEIQDDQVATGDDFHTEDLALYLGMKILDVLK